MTAPRVLCETHAYAIQRESGTCPGAEDPGAEHASLPAGSLADMDLGVFSGAGTVDLFALCARVQLMEFAVAGGGSGGDRRGRSARAAARGRAGALHSALRRGQAESALSESLLYVCVECRAELCAAQSGWARDRCGYRRVVHEANLPLCLYAAMRIHPAAGHPGQITARGR